MNFVWNGITKSKTFKILNKRPDLINVTRLDGQSLYTAFHKAAYGNAPEKIVRQMIEIGAWRTLKNADGERPIDIAKNKNHQLLIQLLEAIYKTSVSIKEVGWSRKVLCK